MIQWLGSLVILTVCAGAQAEAVVTAVRDQSVVITREQAAAAAGARWGLTSTEWLAYERIMGDRRGVWSPGLDPVTALGVSAETTTERNRYAEQYVRIEFERTRKELAFQLAVDQAWRRLYPETPRLSHRSSPAASQATQRYALIVATDCVECADLFAQRLPGMLSEAQEGVDVHVVGTGGDDDVLKRWLVSQPDLLVALKAGQVTVNHGSQFEDLQRFPVVYHKARDGQWIREL